MQLEMVPENSRVLEIGCATGYMSDYLRKRKKCFVYGVEFNEGQCDIARHKCNKVLCGGIDEKKIQESLDEFVNNYGKFDVVLMSQVVEHIAYPNGVLLKIKDWIPDHGVLIISTVNVAHWMGRMKLLFGKWEYEEYGIFDNTHLRFYTPASLKKDLVMLGYEVVSEKYSYYDISPFFFLKKFRYKTAPINIIARIPFFYRIASGLYRIFFNNIFTYQFAYKVRKCTK